MAPLLRITWMMAGSQAHDLQESPAHWWLHPLEPRQEPSGSGVVPASWLDAQGCLPSLFGRQQLGLWPKFPSWAPAHIIPCDPFQATRAQGEMGPETQSTGNQRETVLPQVLTLPKAPHHLPITGPHRETQRCSRVENRHSCMAAGTTTGLSQGGQPAVLGSGCAAIHLAPGSFCGV